MEAYTKDQVLKISFQKRVTEKLSVCGKAATVSLLYLIY